MASTNSDLPEEAGDSNQYQCIDMWYPDLQNTTYFLPPQHFNHVRYNRVQVAGIDVNVPGHIQGGTSQNYPHSPPMASSTLSRNAAVKPALAEVRDSRVKSVLACSDASPRKTRVTCASNTSCQPANPPLYDSDVRADQAQERVFHSLQALAKELSEVMMVIFQLNYDKYLHKADDVATASTPLPRPFDLNKHGDFDILIIRNEGKRNRIIICEMKSVGANFGEIHNVDEDATILKRLKEAIDQLNKAKSVVNYLVPDLQSVEITNTIIFPNISSSKLLTVVNSETIITKSFCQCLGVEDVTTAVQRCIFSDLLPSSSRPDEITQEILSKLINWWRGLFLCIEPKEEVIFQIYKELIFRFCGPLTTVEIPCCKSMATPRLALRTVGEGVSVTGERFARIALTPEQVDVMVDPPPRLCLVGPPGTGKTVMLVLQGLAWLRQDHTVHVLSIYDESRASSFIIEHQLQALYERSTGNTLTTGRIIRLPYMKMMSVINTPIETTSKLCVLADEAETINVNFRDDRLKQFCEKILNDGLDVNLWAAALKRSWEENPLLPCVTLTIPLRSPPVVIREVKKSEQISFWKAVENYTPLSIPADTDGPRVKRIFHRSPGHSSSMPEDCVKCGEETALYLITTLGVGQQGTEGGADKNQSYLEYRDVLILCNDPRDQSIDSNGREMSRVSGLVQGLRDSDVPVRVVSNNANDDDVRETALGENDVVTVTSWEAVRGMERKVVVVPESGGFIFGDNHRLIGMSRCTSQLILLTLGSE